MELLARLVTGDSAWYVDDLIDSVQVIALCTILQALTRRRIIEWCLITAYMLCEVTELLFNAAWYFFDVYFPYADAARVILASLVLLFYLKRRYRVTQAEPPYRDDTIYLVYHKPNTRQDRALAMCGKPYGGVGAYSRGNWYHYSNGKFVVSARQPNKIHVIIAERTYDDSVIERLNDLVGTRWGLLNNCMTEVWPVVKYRSRLHFLPKPRKCSDTLPPR